MEGVLKLASKVAQSDASVLILGENGTGKGILAEQIHHRGARRQGPFVTVPCANIPADLFESELFGHERGAHTDAHARRSGKFEAADGGTILLDGVETLSLGHQAKLLRVLQEKRFERLGGVETVAVDVRVLSASCEELPAMAAAGGFREDLFYRLNVVQIRIPPLRERPEDVTPLAEHFLKGFRRRYRRGPKRLSLAARRLMRAHPWPGNVRELMNVIEAAVISAEGEALEPEEMTLGRRDPLTRLAGAGAGGNVSLAALEEMYIRKVLEQTRGNKSRAAVILGINRKTLLMKLKKFGASDDEAAGDGPDR